MRRVAALSIMAEKGTLNGLGGEDPGLARPYGIAAIARYRNGWPKIDL